MALDILYARIPIELHERELDRVCTDYKKNLATQLRDLTNELNRFEGMVSTEENDAIVRAIERFEHFMPQSQADAIARSVVRKINSRMNLGGQQKKSSEFLSRDSGTTSPSTTAKDQSRGATPNTAAAAGGGGEATGRGASRGGSPFIHVTATAASHQRLRQQSQQQHLGIGVLDGLNRWSSRASSVRSSFGLAAGSGDEDEITRRFGRGMSLTFGEVTDDVPYTASRGVSPVGNQKQPHAAGAAGGGGGGGMVRRSSSLRRLSTGNYSLVAPQSSIGASVQNEWVQQLEEAYNRVCARREMLKEALEGVAEHASSSNTLRVIASTMWPEVRQALGLVLKERALVLPVGGLRQVFASDGGLASGTEESVLDVYSPPLVPLSAAAWEEFSSDAAPKGHAKPEDWQFDDEGDVSDFFAPMNAAQDNPFVTLLESLRYELSLFNFVCNKKRGHAPPTSPGRDRTLRNMNAARRTLTDAAAKVERLAQLWQKEMGDFVAVCRALQRIYVREKREADAMAALHAKRIKTIEQLASLRAAQIVDDEAFAIASGRRTNTPDVTIGGAELRRGLLICDVSVRCRVQKTTLLEELDRLIADTNLRQHRIKRFVDYVDDFVERVDKFDNDVDEALRCPLCKDISMELVSFPNCGHNFCLRCVPEPANTSEGAAYGAYCDVCGTNSKDSFVPNPQASAIAARVRFRHAGCGELRSAAARLRTIFMGAVMDNKFHLDP